MVIESVEKNSESNMEEATDDKKNPETRVGQNLRDHGNKDTERNILVCACNPTKARKPEGLVKFKKP